MYHVYERYEFSDGSRNYRHVGSYSDRTIAVEIARRYPSAIVQNGEEDIERGIETENE